MIKPDFSKAAMKKFFLYHTEKIILATCILLLGLFFWMGFQVEPFDKKTPEELSKLADQAEQHMLSDASWEKIKEFRKGNDKVKETIVNAEASVKPDNFVFAPMIGTVAKTLDPRMDPIVLPVVEPVANVITSPVLITMTTPFTDPFAEFPPAGDPAAVGAAGSGRGGLGSPGGLGARSGDDGEDEEPDDEGEDPGVGRGGSRGGGIGGAGGLGGAGLGGAGLGGGSTAKANTDIPEIDAGNQMHQVNSDTFPAMRPVAHQIPADTTRAIIGKIVVVTGLVDFKTMWNSYDKSFSSGIGYYPDRDKPVFQYLQVERKEIDKDGKEGEWVDWSENVSYIVPDRYPLMHRMPKAMYSTAPDIIAPENFDPLLTGPIPAAVMVDYRPYVLHPKLADKTRQFPEPTKAEEAEEFDPNNLFAQGDSQNGGLLGGAPANPSGRGGGLSGGPGGLGTPGLGGGPGAGSMGGRGGSRGAGAATPGEEVKQTRSGGDFTDYWKALTAKKPTSDYKLVRFFDLQVNEGMKYKYRMRVWVGDPNNEDPTGTFAMLQGGSAPGGLGGLGGLGNRGGIGGTSDPDADEDDDSEAEDGSATGQRSGGSLTKLAITSKMKHPSVRKRLNRAKEVTDPKDPTKKKYFVSEVRSQNEKGEPVYEEIEVPNPEKRPYLRFARPSEWSPEVEVQVESESGQVAAGQVQPPKMVRFSVGGKTVEIPGGEPAAEVAASVWNSDLGTAVTSKRTAFRGDALDFYAPAHVLHPITWRVHVAKNDSRTAEGERQYYVPIQTGSVVVDTLGGDELPLPSSEKMRHNMASEVLVMDDKGTFHVQNDMDDRTTYRNLLFLSDEPQTVGGEKARRRQNQDDEPAGLGGGRGIGGAGGLGGLGNDDDR